MSMTLPDHFLPKTFSALPKAAAVERILRAAVAAADPEQVVQSHLRVDGSTLVAGEARYNLDDYRQVLVTGIGKASVGMAGAVLNRLGERIRGGVVVTKHAGQDRLCPLEVFESSHPVPDERSILAAQRLTALLDTTDESDLVICAISGGGSALVSLPHPSVPLADLQSLTRMLLQSGADIHEMNVLRRHLDQVKGGGLLRHGRFGRWISLILSDVIGGPLEDIASGPTAPDPTTYAGALAVLKKYGLDERAPASVREELARGAAGTVPETLKPGDPVFARVQNLIAGSNLTSARAAARQAEAEGFHTLLIEKPFLGEAARTGGELADLLKEKVLSSRSLARPACIIGGGETTVVVRGNGMGGRNQEVALGAVAGLDGLKDAALITLATDGEDASTDAAGAIVDGDTLRRAAQLGMDPRAFLARNDSYTFFKRLDQLIQTGSTGTNVNDLDFLFAF
jgi:hydroxypyruvate reductase